MDRGNQLPATEVGGVVGKRLQLIYGNPCVIMQHMVVGRLGGALDAGVTVEVEVVLCGMGH